MVRHNEKRSLIHNTAYFSDADRVVKETLALLEYAVIVFVFAALVCRDIRTKNVGAASKERERKREKYCVETARER